MELLRFQQAGILLPSVKQAQLTGDTWEGRRWPGGRGSQWSGQWGLGRTEVQPLRGGGKQATHVCTHTHRHTHGRMSFFSASCNRAGGELYSIVG